VLAVGDGALGFGAAVRDVWPETREQRCWVHRLANVLDKLPKRLQPRAKEALRQIMNAESRSAAEKSTFATVRLRQRVTKGAGSRTRGLVFAYKLLDMASQRWRRLDGAQLLPLVRAGVKFNDGIMQERQDQDVRKDAA
jgi:transposase-like protein